MATAEQEQGDDGRQQEVARKVWNHVRDVMAERGITVSGVKSLERRGIKRATFYRWERALDTRPDHLTQLEVALELPHGELLRLAGRPAPALPGAAGPVSIAILNAEDLEQHEKEALLRVYESFMTAKHANRATE